MRRCAVRSRGLLEGRARGILAARSRRLLAVRSRRLLAVAIGCALALGAASAPAQAKATRVRPTSHAGAIKLRLGAKSSLYHRASRAKPAVYSVTGPTRLKILARSLPPDAGNKAQKVSITLDGKALRDLVLPVQTSKRAALRDGAKAGALRVREIDIPAGAHQVRIRPEGAGGMVALRAFRGVASRAARWVSFAPETFDRAVRLRTADREETWYRLTAQIPVGMTVHGPLRLKVATRLDFDLHAGTTQSYVLRVVRDGKPQESFSLRTLVSHTTTYPELPEITPGMAREVSMSVPAGTHRLSFLLEGATAPGASLRIRVPESDLKKQRRAATPKVNGRGRT